MPKYKNILKVSRRTFNRRVRNSRFEECCSTQIKTSLNNTSKLNETSDEQFTFFEETNHFDSDNESTLSELENAEDLSNDVDVSDFLLIFLKSNDFPQLPKDSRTLLQTPKSRDVVCVDPGEYVHIGLKNGLDNILRNEQNIPNTLRLDFNIDGVPLSKSTNSSFWLILARVFNLNDQPIFTVGIYFGKNKPKSFSEFLTPFVEELKNLTALTEN